MMRSHRTHLSFEDVYELRQLIDAPAPYKATDRGYARIVFYFKDRTVRLVSRLKLRLTSLGVLVHRAKLVAEEDLLVGPDPHLAKEDRARRGQLDQGRNRQEQRGERQQPEQRTHNVEETLELPLGVIQPGISDLEERHPCVLEEDRIASHERDDSRHDPKPHPTEANGAQQIQKRLV